MSHDSYDILVIGGGHAGAEAAWAAANLGARTALLTMDPARIGQMSCNPAIGGLAKGQMVREIDALGGLMGLATDATGIQFKMLNASKGPAVRGPRAQADKYAYALEVQRLLATRENLTILTGTVDEILVENGRCVGVQSQISNLKSIISASAVILTTGTFMRGLMHRGESQTPGGRIDEPSAEGISGNLRRLGFELGRLKTGTPPRLAAESIDFAALEVQKGDEFPAPFSDMTGMGGTCLSRATSMAPDMAPDQYAKVWERFPFLEQRVCHITHTNESIHDTIRANLHRAPMYNGQIATAGPRYCPSIEDKVVRFADKERHTVFLEPESLTTNEIYCNGISTSLPQDVQERIVRGLPGCQNARILRFGYAVEYDMVPAHQIDATCMTKRVAGLFFAGQINGTTGYEEAAAQGVVAGINAVRFVRGQERVRFRRDESYIGVLMDDLVTKVPLEPYRMFTSRAEHRLYLRSDNASERLTPLGRELGVVDDARWGNFTARREALGSLLGYLKTRRHDGLSLFEHLKRPEFDERAVMTFLPGDDLPALARDRRVVESLVSEVKYAPFLVRDERQRQRMASMEGKALPAGFDFGRVTGLRTEAAVVLNKFRPATYGQASRLAGINPADLTVLSFTLDGR